MSNDNAEITTTHSWQITRATIHDNGLTLSVEFVNSNGISRLVSECSVDAWMRMIHSEHVLMKLSKLINDELLDRPGLSFQKRYEKMEQAGKEEA